MRLAAISLLGCALWAQYIPPFSGTATSTGTGGVPGYTANGLISGGGVAWAGNLVFTVSAAKYVINTAKYSSAQTNITLAAADPSNDRIDVIYVDTGGLAGAITGTPAVSPSQPTVDPSTQLLLTFVYVAANATTPSNISTNLLYDEGAGWTAEWNATTSGSGWTLASTNNPYHGSKDIEATSVGTGASVQLARGGGTTDPTTVNVLVFYIRSKASWGSKRSLTIALANSSVQVGQAVTFAEGSFGFTSATTSSYQQIYIPLALFQTGAVFNQITFTVAGTGSNLGFYLDYAQLQGGSVQQNANTAMNFRGAWSSTTAYNQNDVVTSGGSTWIAKLASSNSTPSGSNANWSILAASTSSGMTLINQTILNSSAGSITISSIPSTYIDLVVSFMGRMDAGSDEDIYLQVNGDTNTNYDRQYMVGSVTTVSAGQTNGINTSTSVICTIPGSGAIGGFAGACDIVFPAYSQTTFDKQALSRFGWRGSTTFVGDIWWQWHNTAAINSLKFTPITGGRNFVAGTTVAVWGRF